MCVHSCRSHTDKGQQALEWKLPRLGDVGEEELQGGGPSSQESSSGGGVQQLPPGAMPLPPLQPGQRFEDVYDVGAGLGTPGSSMCLSRRVRVCACPIPGQPCLGQSGSDH